MSLESDNRGVRLGVIESGHIDAIAVARKHGLECFHLQSFGASLEPRTVFDGTRSDEVANSAVCQLTPRKMFAGIVFSIRRQIGMRENARWRDFPARGYVLAKRDYRFDLLWLVGWQARNMTVVGDFDPDRNSVHVTVASPNSDASVPSTPQLRDKLKKLTLFIDEIMRRNLRGFGAKVIEGSRARRDPGIMQDDRVGDLALTIAMIGRGTNDRGKRTVWCQ